MMIFVIRFSGCRLMESVQKLSEAAEFTCLDVSENNEVRDCSSSWLHVAMDCTELNLL